MFYILLGVLLGFFICYKIIKPSHHWKNRNVIYEPGWPIVGNMGKVLLRRQLAIDLDLQMYKKYSDKRYVGCMQFLQPFLMIRNIDLIKKFSIKEFDHFHDRMVFPKIENDLVCRSLIFLHGQAWQEMRATLSPVFTSSKMRIMYQLMQECANNFVRHFKRKEEVIPMKMKEVLSRFTTDVIASTAFGVRINTLDDPKNSFFLMTSRLDQGILAFAKLMILAKFPRVAKLLGTKILPTDVTQFFKSAIKDNIEKRERNGIVRPDLIHLLVQVRKGQLKQHETKTNKNEGFAAVEESQMGKSTKKIQLTDDDIVAQAMLFFFAGFDSVATVASFMAYELAINPEIQKKLQQEIDKTNQQYPEKISYEALLSMKYLDQVVSETLRLWTPAFQSNRICTKDFIIEAENSEEAHVVIRKGEGILIPIAGIHRDPKYYSEPERFDPERFNDENKLKILPGTYLPFGLGPRNCIGSRFALLEIKTLFFHLLLEFDIIPTGDTQIPVKLSKKSFNLIPEDGIILMFTPRKAK